jgi:hypothetical protein
VNLHGLLPASVPNPEVLEKPLRRRFTAEYKLRILKEVDALTDSGQIGALLRREGLYSSISLPGGGSEKPGPSRPSNPKNAAGAAGGETP